MLENIFAGGTETRLSSLKNRFYTAIPVVRQDIMSALKNEGHLHARSGIGQWIQHRGGHRDSRPFGILQYLGWMNFLQLALLLVVCVPVSALIWWLFARVMTAKTVIGARITSPCSASRSS